MVALLEPTFEPTLESARTNPGDTDTSSPGPSRRSHLHLVPALEGSPRSVRSSRSVRTTPAIGAVPLGPVVGVVAAVVVVFGLLVAVRSVQGQPPASNWAELPGSGVRAEVAAGPGDQIRLAVAGDSFWALALELAPDGDPRAVSARLVEANGGVSSIQVGQRLVIPADVIGAGSPQP